MGKAPNILKIPDDSSIRLSMSVLLSFDAYKIALTSHKTYFFGYFLAVLQDLYIRRLPPQQKLETEQRSGLTAQKVHCAVLYFGTLQMNGILRHAAGSAQRSPSRFPRLPRRSLRNSQVPFSCSLGGLNPTHK